MAKSFASQSDLAEKREELVELAPGAYCLTAEGDPNSGVIVGDDGVMVIDARATPAMAQDLIRRIRKVTRKPIKYVLLTHYHAVRVMGASAYGAELIIASRGTYDLIVERGRQDFKSEVQRFPRLFRDVESVPGLTWPNLVFEREITLWLGQREVKILHLGRGHTKGDTVAWLPKERVLYSGDLVEQGATPYAGDAYFRDWPATLDQLAALNPRRLVPGRGPALMSPRTAQAAIEGTRGFVSRLYAQAKRGVQAKQTLKQVYDRAYRNLGRDYGGWVIFDHCMPFDVSRAYDEAGGLEDPAIWTARRDLQLWKSLAG